MRNALYARVCAHACARALVCVRTCMCARACAGMRVCTLACLRVRVHLRARVQLLVCAHMRVYARACLRVCVWVRVCVSAWWRRHHQFRSNWQSAGGGVWRVWALALSHQRCFRRHFSSNHHPHPLTHAYTHANKHVNAPACSFELKDSSSGRIIMHRLRATGHIEFHWHQTIWRPRSAKRESNLLLGATYAVYTAVLFLEYLWHTNPHTWDQ